MRVWVHLFFLADGVRQENAVRLFGNRHWASGLQWDVWSHSLSLSLGKGLRMVSKQILVPTDFSSASQAAMEYATAIARQNDATLLIVHVEEVPVAAMIAGEFATPLYPNPEIAKQLETVVPPDDHVHFQRRLLRGMAIE